MTKTWKPFSVVVRTLGTSKALALPRASYIVPSLKTFYCCHLGEVKLLWQSFSVKSAEERIEAFSGTHFHSLSRFWRFNWKPRCGNEHKANFLRWWFSFRFPTAAIFYLNSNRQHNCIAIFEIKWKLWRWNNCESFLKKKIEKRIEDCSWNCENRKLRISDKWQTLFKMLTLPLVSASSLFHSNYDKYHIEPTSDSPSNDHGKHFSAWLMPENFLFLWIQFFMSSGRCFAWLGNYGVKACRCFPWCRSCLIRAFSSPLFAANEFGKQTKAIFHRRGALHVGGSKKSKFN